MFNNQNLNNEGNNEVVYTNDNRLQRVGLYISDNFDQSSNDTIDLTEDDQSPNESVRSHLVQTRVVPVHHIATKKPRRMVSNVSGLKSATSDIDISDDISEDIVNVDGTHRSIYLMNDKMDISGRRKCAVAEVEGQQEVDDDEYHAVIVHQPEAKIPRPPNAFMIFANEWRKKVAHKYNNESNKDISVRLGHMWRNLDKSRKEEYFAMARKADAEHKVKYPDYVYNPKEARLRKALRDSWKDKGRRTPNGQIRCAVGKSPANWSGKFAHNRTISPKPGLSDMTFSMAADGYSMMETPAWSNTWYSYRHNPVPYIVPQFSEAYNGDSNDNYSDRIYHQQMNVQDGGVRTNVMGSSHSPFTDHNEPVENNKGPLSQLQELTNVFSSADACTRNSDNEIKQEMPTSESDIKYSQVLPKTEVESTAFNNDSDSGYITDHPNVKEAAGENDFNKNVSKTGVTDMLMTESNGDSFMETFESNGQSNYINVDDVFLDCNFLSGEKNFGESSGNSGRDVGGRSGDGRRGGGEGDGGNLESGDAQGKNVLPGFQQAFGSTEIGRFSRNDFFTNPPPEAPDKVSTDNQLESSNEGTQQLLRKSRTKSVRKPRKVKNPSKKTEDTDEKRTTTHNNLQDDYFCERQNGCVKKGRRVLNVDKSDMCNRHESELSEQSPYMPPFGYSPSMTSYGNQSIPPYREDPQPPSSYPTPRSQPYQGVDLPYGNQYLRPDPIFPHAYDNYQHRYGYSEYPENHYPYMRNNYTPNYSNYEYPYFRPFGFHLDYGESWSNSGSNWSGQGWVAGQQPPYNSWPTPNMIPFMRLDY